MKDDLVPSVPRAADDAAVNDETSPPKERLVEAERLSLRERGVRVAHFGWAKWLRRWRGLRPQQQVLLGLASWAGAGVAALSLPWAQAQPVRVIDNAFNVVSAISTTGLATVSVADSYTFFGELVILLLFQLGGIGYMTLTSFFILARGRRLTGARLGILHAAFTLPEGLSIQRFVLRVVAFTAVIEALGAAVLFAEFRAAGVEGPLWFAVFHSVSAFATAGFSLSNTSLEPFRASVPVNVTISVLCYLGAIGFIVLQDAWQAAASRQRRITFTSKVILWSTAIVFVAGTPVFYLVEPSARALPAFEGWMAAGFQVMTASTTAGFNTISIGPLARAAILLTMAAMIIGASPSGTGGGIKTTSVSALLAVVSSIMRGQARVTLLGREVPTARVLFAVASTSFYLAFLAAGTFLLCLTEGHDLVRLTFEAISAIGTVGLSMGITGDLTDAGKLIVMALMFAGRAGPLTLGVAMLHRRDDTAARQTPADLACDTAWACP